MSQQVRSAIGAILIIAIFSIGIGLIIHGNRVVAQRPADTLRQDSLDPVYYDDIEEGNMLAPPEITINIEGAVRMPGVYRLPAGSVMHDAIIAAGGFSADVDRVRIAREMNQAAPIGDHAKIYIFTNSDREVTIVNTANTATVSEKIGSSISSSNSLQSSLINLNTATLQELDTLSGIGPAIAQRIIDWRDENGGFEVVDDLKKVKGIGDTLFAGVKDQVVVQ